MYGLLAYNYWNVVHMLEYIRFGERDRGIEGRKHINECKEREKKR